MSYTKTPYDMTESEWKRVEKYIDEHDDIYYSIRDDMWFDVCDWLSNNYNRRGNTIFKCDSIAFDGDNAVLLGKFRIDEDNYYYLYDIHEDYTDDYELRVAIDVNETNNNLDDEIHYPMFGNNVIFNVGVYHYDTDGYTDIVDFEIQCNISEFKNMSTWFAKHDIARECVDMLEYMQDTIDKLNDKFEKFDTEVIDMFAEWFAMRGTAFRKYLDSYQRFDVEFDNNGEVVNIEL